MFDESVLQYTNGSESENLKSTADTNTDDITEGSVPTTDLGESESEKSDYPSDQSDMQSSIKEENVMEQLEEEHNVPLFLSLNCTIRDKSHLSNTMVSMPAEYLPACFGKSCPPPPKKKLLSSYFERLCYPTIFTPLQQNLR